MKPTDLAQLVADLAERVAALEAGPRPLPPARARGDLTLVQSIVDDLPTGDDGDPLDGRVVYVGAGPGPDGLTAFQMDHRWNDLLDADPTPMALCLAALGNPLRVQIVQMLLRGPVSTADLTGALDGPSSGQLFHHLKDLLAAGLIHQPNRGSYATRPQQIVPLLVALACATDLALPNMDPGEQ